ncbi:MAG: Zn-binding domain-containing protein, partial [Planctomyces sp.]
VLRYAEGLQEGFDLWKSEHRSVRRVFPHVQYYMLHSLSHLLITAISLECGYPASSIRERIYAFDDEGYGILLYTGSSDSEGTLGGLVLEGRRIHEHMRQALTQAELCSNDPVCS